MSSQEQLPFPTLLRDVVHLDTFNVAFVDNDANAMYDTHQQPDDLECQAVISSMVQESVFKGFLKALEEDFHTQLADKEKQIDDLKGQLKQTNAIVSDIKRLGLMKIIGDPDMPPAKTVWDFLEESEKKWKKSEDYLLNKEKELEQMASNMVQIASMLENEMVRAQQEMRRANEFDHQLAELKEQETIRIGQIASLQQENGKLRIDNSRLKRQALVKERQLKDNMVCINEEIEERQLQLEKITQEKQALEKCLMEKGKAFSDLKNDYECLESQLRSSDETLKDLLMERNNIQGVMDEMKLVQELLITYIEQEINEMREKFKYCTLQGSEFLTLQQSSWKHYSCDGRYEREAISVDEMNESTWKANTETTIFELVIEKWYKEAQEMLHKLTFELAWKDEVILKYDQQSESHKQTIEELENDYATLMSICLALLRDQNDNDTVEGLTSVPAHEIGRRKLMELSELLSSRDASGGQVEQLSTDFQFEEQLSSNEPRCMVVSDILDQEISTVVQCTIDSSIHQREKTFMKFQTEEDHLSQQLGQMLELEIISEILTQKYKESLPMGFDLKTFPSNDKNELENMIKKYCDNFEDLEAQIEHFLELEASRLERMRSICSKSIANCEFKLGNLTNRLADQMNEMKMKISFAQETIKEQEWKHMVQEDIFLWVLSDVLMQRRRNMKDPTQHALHITTRASKPSVNLNNYLDLIDTFDSPKVTEDHHVKLSDEGKISSCIKVPDSPSGIQDKDKLIVALKALIEDLRKEKAVVEQKLDAITEEVYSLKRQFWKEKEIWVSKLSQPQRRDVEAQVEALLRHSPKSRNFDDELKKVEMAMFEDLISDSKREWLLEKENLLHIISRKEVEMENLMMELSRFRGKQQNCFAKQSDLLEEISDLNVQIDNLSNKILDNEFHFEKCKELWHAEKECMKQELHKLLVKEKAHMESSRCLSGRIAELERNIERSTLERLDQESSFLILKKEWSSEMEDLRGQITHLLEKEHTHATLQDCLLGRIVELKAKIEKLCAEKLSAVSSYQELQTERDNLKVEVHVLLQREQAYAVLEGHLLANVAELECQLETTRLDRVDQESSFLILKREWKREMEDLRGQFTHLLEKEHAYITSQDCLSSRIAELETEIDKAFVENLSAISSSRELQTERDNLKVEVEILLQRELSYAVLEGHLLANIAELEGRLETSNLKRVAVESSFSILESVWKTERDHLRGQISDFLDKEHAHAALHGQLLCRIAELEAQIDRASLEELNARSYLEKLQTERDILKGKAEILLQREQAYAVLEGHLLGNVAELECRLETSNLERVAEESSFSILEREWKIEREDLRGQFSEFLEKEHAQVALKDQLSRRIAELESQIDIAACCGKVNAVSSIKELQKERDSLRGEVEILLQREHAYAVLEGHLLANLAELQCWIEPSHLERGSEESSLFVLERRWKNERENLNGKGSELLDNENAQAALQDQLSGRIAELEAQIDIMRLEKLDAQSHFRKLQTERDNLKEVVASLLQREQAYAVLEGYLLGKVVELEIQIEISYLERLAEESSLSMLEKEWEGERQNLREQVTEFSEKEHSHAALQAHLSDRIAELEAQIDLACLEKHNAATCHQKLLTESDNLRQEVEILLQREHAYAVVEGHLLANITNLEILVETSRLQRLDEESSFLIMQKELQTERDNLRGMVRGLIQKEHAYAVLEGHLLGTVVELEVDIEVSRQRRHDQEFWFISMKRDGQNEIQRLTAEIEKLVQQESVWCATIRNLEIELERSEVAKTDQVLSLQTLKQDWETEKTVLTREIEVLVEKEHSYAHSLDHLSVKMAEMEAEVEAARLAKFNQELLFAKSKTENEMDTERLLAEIEKLSERVEAYSLSEDCLVARVKKLEGEIESSSQPVNLDSESSPIKLLQVSTNGRDKCFQVSSEREHITSKPFVPREIETSNSKVNDWLELEKYQKTTDLETVSKLMEQFGRFLQSSQEMEKKIDEILHKRSLSLDRIKRNCRFLNGRIKSFTVMETHYKQKLAKELSNLQKAETEVDLLGDEVEALLGILEEVQIAFDIYAPVLHHYPKMTEVAKLVKHEIQLRIDPKYGA